MPGLSIENGYAEIILDSIFGTGHAAAWPSTWKVSLWKGDPTDTGVEQDGTSYARVTVNNNDAQWAAATGHTKSNALAITFPVAGSDWDPSVYWGLHDPDNADALAFSGRFNNADPPILLTGGQLVIAVGGLVVNITDTVV
jgi:hypothetical protein